MEPLLFHGLSEPEIRVILDAAIPRVYSRREWLNHQGDSFDKLCLVQSGLLRITQLLPEGEEILIRLIGPGDVFGYHSLHLDHPSICSAQTMQRSELLVWESQLALDILQSIPTAAVNLFRIAVRDVVYFYDRAVRLQTQPVAQRVEWALSELARVIGLSEGGSLIINEGVGQRELAELAGTTIFTVSRELGKLQRQGILDKERGRIVVHHADKLKH